MIEVKKNLHKIQFDQFSRLYIAFHLIKSTYNKKKLRILDVGGHLGKTRDFFKDDEIVVADLYDVREKNYVKASGLKLPFHDNEFDAVVTFDVLEHIDSKDRSKFMEELCRVSKDIIIIAAPMNTALVAKTEDQVNKLYKSLYGANHRWLNEHLQNGLPDEGIVSAYIEKRGFKHKVYSSNNIFLWKMMISFLFLCGDSRIVSLSAKANKYYNEHLQSLNDTEELSYRKIFFVRKKGELVNLPEFKSKLDPEIYNGLLEIIFEGMLELLKDKRLSIEEAAAIKERTVVNKMNDMDIEIKNLKAEIRAIKSSKSWKIAQVLSKTKNRIY